MAHVGHRGSAHPVLTGLTIAIATVIATGMVLLWPGELEPSGGADVLRRGEIVRARVSSIEIAPCGSTTGAARGQGAAPSPAPGTPRCRGIALFVREGPDQGTRVRLELPDIPSSPDLAVDEEVLLERPPAEIPGMPYGFYDRIRSPSLLWLALIFGGSVVLLGRLRGLAALVGLAVSVAILLAFVIPAILEGSSPILVASIGAGAIGFIVLYLAHGFSRQTTVAVLGTLTGVCLTLVLSLIWTPLAKLSGLASESAFIVQAVGVEIDVAGLLLAGIVIGALVRSTMSRSHRRRPYGRSGPPIPSSTLGCCSDRGCASAGTT